MRVRKIIPTDETPYQSILMRTSEEDRYYRFFKAVDLEGAEVQSAVDDRDDMLGFIAFDGRCALGAAHAALIDARTAEVAIIVAGDAREQGVGKALLVTLITYLQRRGYSRIIAHSLQENSGFAHLAASAGFHIEHAAGADIRWVFQAAPMLPTLVKSRRALVDTGRFALRAAI